MESVVSRITDKGQLILPKSVRDRLKLEKGSYIAIYLENNQIVMKKVAQKPLGDAGPNLDMAGMIRGGSENQCEKETNSPGCKIRPIREAATRK